MPYGRIVLNSIIALIAQIWVGSHFQQYGAEPQFILLYVMFLSCCQDVTAGMFVGFFLGMAEDVLRMQCFGLSALTYVLVGYLPRLLGNFLFLENLVSRYIFLVVAHVLKIILDSTVEPALTHRLPMNSIFLPQRLRSLGFDAILLPVLLFIWSRAIGVRKKASGQSRSRKQPVGMR